MKNLLKTPFAFSLLRNSSIQFVWWVIFFPGFYSGDSFGAVAMAKSGDLTNSGTASWALYVRIFSFFGHAIAMLTLLSGFILVYSVTRLAYALFENRPAAIASFILTFTPLVAGMGITLWHDIPYTSGFLLISAFLVTCIRNPEGIKSGLIPVLVPGAFLSSFKPSGLPTLIVFAILMTIFKITRVSTKYVAGAILLSGALTFVGANLILGMSPINSLYAQEWMRGDISCFASAKQGQGFVEKEIPSVGNTTKWASEASCNFLNKADLTIDEKIASEKYVPNAWFHLLKMDPFFVFKTHLTRHAYLIPFPILGIPSEPFLHSTIEYKYQGIEWAFPSVAGKARILMRIWNAARGLTGWAGLWFVILLALSVLRNQKSLIPVITMSIAMISILFVVAPIPDGRYALFVLIAGQLALIGNIVAWAPIGSNRRPRE